MFGATIELEDIFKESWPKRWAIKGTDHGREFTLAEFTASFKAHGYIAYVKDFSTGEMFYANPRYSHPDGYDARKIFRFFIEYGCECMWPRNDEAEEYCYSHGSEIDDFPFSDSLKKELLDACDEYERHGLAQEGDSDDWNEDQWDRFHHEVEAPLAARVSAELGPDFLVLYGDDKQ